MVFILFLFYVYIGKSCLRHDLHAQRNCRSWDGPWVKYHADSFALTRITYFHVDSPPDDHVVRQTFRLPPEPLQGPQQPVVEQDVTVGEAVVSGARISGNTSYDNGLCN